MEASGLFLRDMLRMVGVTVAEGSRRFGDLLPGLQPGYAYIIRIRQLDFVDRAVCFHDGQFVIIQIRNNVLPFSVQIAAISSASKPRISASLAAVKATKAGSLRFPRLGSGAK